MSATKKISLLIFGCFSLMLLYAFVNGSRVDVRPYSGDNEKQKELLEMSLEDALIRLGDAKPIHYVEKLDLDSARMGEELVKYGRLQDKSNKRISKFFVCTDCHNLQKESADPADESPAAVAEYGMKNNLPFLPAATFYGMYNKRHWYNGDYQKKYGDLVRTSKDSLKNAIQLCATQCSQGREMVNWEIRSVLHYFKSLEYKIGDLQFEKDEVAKLQKYLTGNNSAAIKLLKTKYSEVNPATFGTSKIPEIEGYQPNFETGEYIYKKGCLHCHSVDREMTNFDLGDDKLSYKFLKGKLYAYNQYSISHITRYGTYAMNGRKQYMPQYSMENMSDEQMLDLIHFIKTKADE
jgi:mono/diheme cytochrome c family protein